MKRCRRSRGLGVGVAVLALAAGCQQPVQKHEPGALPTNQPLDKSARINATTYFAHGSLLERQGSFERAVVQYQRALELRPNFVTARNRLGITLNKLGRHADATEQFRMAIDLSPNLAHLYNNLGFSLYLQEQHADAKVALARAVELAPGFNRARMNLAVVLAKLGEYEEAYAQLILVGEQADADFNMGMLLTEAGRYALAARHFEQALAARPDFEAAREQLHQIARLAAEQEERNTRMQVARAAAAQAQADHAELAAERAGIAALSQAGPGVVEVNQGRTIEQPAPESAGGDVPGEEPPAADKVSTEETSAEQGVELQRGAFLELLGDLMIAWQDVDPEAVDQYMCELEYTLFPDTRPDPREEADAIAPQKLDPPAAPDPWSGAETD